MGTKHSNAKNARGKEQTKDKLNIVDIAMVLAKYSLKPAPTLPIKISLLVGQKNDFLFTGSISSRARIPEQSLPIKVVKNLKSPSRPYSLTGFKGVITREEGYRVRVWTPQPPHKKYVGGLFKTDVEAAMCYDEYMLHHVGDWVYLNFPREKLDYQTA